ncbi:hypothetical protein H696_04572 [Fonticula alba]|uniref:SSD domain-containing protein n=1 Tax=Fonticula alba TaxID=691883 RepID=A0A058Z5D7_FONAL|nr:hypothetical protein H696_04572 [Fonticula alba]KCV69158.1 hypothetical protein H696_04572 [Fonticula alba]|eukprot:XP_009496729.1 hypothetical protein H696_04572 [Fonticula alba]
MEVGAGDTLHPDSHRAPGPAAATATGAPSFHPNATHAPRPKARESFLKQCRSSLSAAIQSRVAAICYRHGLYCATHPFLIIYVTFLAFLICTYPAMNSFEKVLAKRAALAAASPSGRTLFGLSLDWQQHGLPGLAAVGAAVGALPLLGALVPADWRTPAIPNVFPAPAPGSADPEAIATLTRDAYSHGSYLRIDPVVFRTGDCCQGEWRPVPGEGATSASSASWVGSGDGGGWAGPITEAGTGTNADPACTDGGLLDTARLLSVLRFQSAVEQFLLLPDAASPVEDLLSLSTEDPAADPIRPSSATTGFRDICWRASSDPSRCLIHTPLEFWLSDAGRLLADGDIRGTVARRDARSSFGSLIEAGSLFGGLSGAAAPSDGRSTSPAAGASGWSRAASVQLTFLSMVRHEQAGLVDNFWHSFWQRSLSGDFSPSVPLGRPEPEATDTPECDATLPAALFQDDGLTLPAGHALLGAPGPARVHRLGQTNRFLYSYPNSPAGGARQHAGGPDGGALQRLLAGRMYLLEAAIIFLSYLLVYVYVSLMLGRVELVKSKFGLAFSALMIVFASLIMSIGVCSLLGYELGLLPWELLSFLVLAIGLESTFALTNAVTATPCDLPVKERVGRGLGSAGVSILRNLVLELVLMALGGFFNIQALTEFCMFTAVAVIINFFIHMSFFATVLSIDIRCLEVRPVAAFP